MSLRGGKRGMRRSHSTSDMTPNHLKQATHTATKHPAQYGSMSRGAAHHVPIVQHHVPTVRHLSMFGKGDAVHAAQLHYAAEKMHPAAVHKAWRDSHNGPESWEEADSWDHVNAGAIFDDSPTHAAYNRTSEKLAHPLFNDVDGQPEYALDATGDHRPMFASRHDASMRPPMPPRPPRR
jgi:hypothetical protein